MAPYCFNYADEAGMNAWPQIRIAVHFKPTELGGRAGPLDLTTSCRYRPHLVVGSGEHLGVCFVQSCTPEVLPGDTVNATVALVYSGVDYAALVPGAEFNVMEGARAVATGKVLGKVHDQPSPEVAS
jgi:translation elongation factor EF-Tu-like GTPase